MGDRGPLKLPKHLRPVSAEEVADTAADVVAPWAPPKPEAVADDVGLSALWDEIVPTLDEAGLLARSDGPAVELALRHFRAARAASDELSSGPAATWDEKNGRQMKNPAEVVFRSESMAFLEYAKQLGMTFAARARNPAARGDDGAESNPFAPASNG